MDADMSWDGEPIEGMSDADAKLLAELRRLSAATDRDATGAVNAATLPQRRSTAATGSTRTSNGSGRALDEALVDSSLIA